MNFKSFKINTLDLAKVKGGQGGDGWNYDPCTLQSHREFMTCDENCVESNDCQTDCAEFDSEGSQPNAGPH